MKLSLAIGDAIAVLLCMLAALAAVGFFLALAWFLVSDPGRGLP